MFKDASYQSMLDVATSRITQIWEMCVQEKERLNVNEIWIIKTSKQTSHNEYLVDYGFKLIILCSDTYVDVVENVVEQNSLPLEVAEDDNFVVMKYECPTTCYSDFLWNRFLKKLYDRLSCVIPSHKMKKRDNVGIIDV